MRFFQVIIKLKHLELSSFYKGFGENDFIIIVNLNEINS